MVNGNLSKRGNPGISDHLIHIIFTWGDIGNTGKQFRCFCSRYLILVQIEPQDCLPLFGRTLIFLKAYKVDKSPAVHLTAFWDPQSPFRLKSGEPCPLFHCHRPEQTGQWTQLSSVLPASKSYLSLFPRPTAGVTGGGARRGDSGSILELL